MIDKLIRFRFLRKKAESGVIVNQKLIEKLKEKKPIAVDARLVVDRNRWFLITLALTAITAFALVLAWNASKRADANIKVAWVKMYPNGTWDVEFHDETRQVEFFKTTIDFLIRNYIERRFREVPYAIDTDYGFALKFMAPPLSSEFMAKDGFNAADRAAKVASCIDCPFKEIEVRNIDHYDSDRTKFGKHDAALYRSNVFITETTKNHDGTVKERVKKIVSLHWRLKSKEEIQAEKQKLKDNPVGLEILKNDVIIDPSN
jgi:hypothetical protein